MNIVGTQNAMGRNRTHNDADDRLEPGDLFVSRPAVEIERKLRLTPDPLRAVEDSRRRPLLNRYRCLLALASELEVPLKVLLCLDLQSSGELIGCQAGRS